MNDRDPAKPHRRSFFVKRSLRALLPICALAAVVGLAVAGPAAASTPCWKTLINDWYDGRIDGTYAIPCYQQAINHLPTDIQQYSSAASDIRRALEARMASSSTHKGATAAPGTTTGGGGNGAGGGGAGKPKNPSGGGSGTTVPQPTSGRQKDHSAIGGVINAGTDHADSVPIPLLVLAGIAGLLLAAGSAGFVARRMQARRVPARRPQS